MSEQERKITLAFRWWWLRHRKHLILKHPYMGIAWCAKCQIVAPEVYK